MDILVTELFEQQLKEILDKRSEENLDATKSFKMYLDTILINMPTKANKYKPSRYFEDESIRDIEHQGFIIPFYRDNENDIYLLLSIVEK